jgi:hypothetical protein
MLATVNFELQATDLAGFVADAGQLAATEAIHINYHTPTGASDPLVSVTFDDSPAARQAIADLLGDPDFDALLDDRSAFMS